MKGKKKGKFYIYCKVEDELWVEEREGWIKEGIGFCRCSQGHRWMITDLKSGASLSKNSFPTLDEGWKFYMKNKNKIDEKKKSGIYKDTVEMFSFLVKTKEKEEREKI